jgi:hypothetical protein
MTSLWLHFKLIFAIAVICALVWMIYRLLRGECVIRTCDEEEFEDKKEFKDEEEFEADALTPAPYMENTNKKGSAA